MEIEKKLLLSEFAVAIKLSKGIRCAFLQMWFGSFAQKRLSSSQRV